MSVKADVVARERLFDILSSMTKQLQAMMERVKKWPAWRQQDAVHLLMRMEKAGTEVYRLSDEERELIDEGLAEADRGEFVPEKEMEKFWNRHHV